ncbi:hypothetical protein J6590_051264 [Homalodisca vitripennis]|nr:hypothetical protein J6590_051264 [Homalodisca vitripennis]
MLGDHRTSFQRWVTSIDEKIVEVGIFLRIRCSRESLEVTCKQTAAAWQQPPASQGNLATGRHLHNGKPVEQVICQSSFSPSTLQD